MLICLFGAVRFHTALNASESEIVNKTTHVLKFIRSLHRKSQLGKQQAQEPANHGDLS